MILPDSWRIIPGKWGGEGANFNQIDLIRMAWAVEPETNYLPGWSLSAGGYESATLTSSITRQGLQIKKINKSVTITIHSSA